MLTLKIISPKGTSFDGEVELVKVPGTAGLFEILENHAPIISSLEKGVVEYTVPGQGVQTVNIGGGFVELHDNIVSLCIEIE